MEPDLKALRGPRLRRVGVSLPTAWKKSEFVPTHGQAA
jgi:hypothetical protein